MTGLLRRYAPRKDKLSSSGLLRHYAPRKDKLSSSGLLRHYAPRKDERPSLRAQRSNPEKQSKFRQENN